MRASTFFLSTLKEAPAEAELVSHKLMLRAGLIKKLGTGLYTWMPLGLRVLRRVEQIVRQEMNRSGAIELLTTRLVTELSFSTRLILALRDPVSETI